MPIAYYLVAVLPAIAACLSGTTALYAWQRREVNGSKVFALCSASTAIWCFFAVFEQLSPTELQQIIFGRLQYLGIPAFPVLWFLFTLRHTERDGWINKTALKALSIIPLISILLAFTDSWHGWIWKTIEFKSAPYPQLIIDHGWWFSYIIAPHGYLFILGGFGVLLSASFSGSRLRRQQTLMLAGAILVTLIGNILYIMADITLYGLDPTPVGFSVTMILIQISLYHAKFLEVTPISYKSAFLNAEDAVVLLDKRQYIVDLNPSALAESQQKDKTSDAIGQPFEHIFPDYRALFEKVGESDTERTEILKFSRFTAKPSDDPETLYRQVKMHSILGTKGRASGWVIIIRDITIEKQQQAQLERLAYFDSLTRLYNRRQLEIRAEEILTPPSQAPISIAILYMDLNHFKLINDNYGHDVGDAVLQYVARCLQRSVRKGDMVVRLGGDEFVALLYEADVEVAVEVRLRLTKMLSQVVTLIWP